ncbi:MAG: outer membrane beta-barrel protein [Bacteroidales bacterium]
MKKTLLIIICAVFSVFPIFAQSFEMDTITYKLDPNMKEHLIGVKYNYAFTNAFTWPDMSPKYAKKVKNISLMYTYYHPMWAFNYFGIQTGIRYSEYEFIPNCDNEEYNELKQTTTNIEVPILTAIHYNIGEKYRVLFSFGPYLGYRLTTDQNNGFNNADPRWDYGIDSNIGFAIRMHHFEIHIETEFKYSFSFLYDPKKIDNIYWIHIHPYQISPGITLYYHF